MSEFTLAISELFSKNPAILKNGEFISPLTEYLSTFNSAEVIDIRGKQIDVDIKGFKSGLQVYELDHQNVQIRNERRRRAHAFSYKTSFKNKEGLKTTLKYNIGGSDVSENDLAVNPRLAITSVSGALKDVAVGKILGKDAEIGQSENGPINLPLKDSESEATYKVRVVGPGGGNLGGLSLTKAEEEKLNRLIIETFAMDFLVPFIFDVIGMDDAVFGSQTDDFKEIISAIDLFIKSTPAIEQSIMDGDYIKALNETMWIAIQEAPGKYFDEMFTAVTNRGFELLKATKPGSVQESAEDVAKMTKSVLKAFKIADYILKAVDYKYLLDHIQLSEYIAEFTATVKADDLVMTPKESTVVTQTNTTFKVETKTTLAEGESFVYKWSTSGKYGKLSYQNKKDVYFEASTGSMIYRAEAPSGDLSDGPNIDTVKVEVFTKKGTALTRIGDAKGVINVQKIKLIMKPKGITLAGGQNVALYLERTDGVNDIISNAALDYKVEWETSGTYGKFNGTLKNATTMGNRLNYEVLDKDVRQGTETFTARVYFKAKTDTEWMLREEVKGDLKIVNDPKKIIMNIPLTAKSWDISTATSCNLGVNWMVEVPVHPKAIRYTVTFFGFKKPYSWEGRGGSWTATQSPPSVYGFPGAGPNEIVGGNYYYTISRSWGAGPMSADCGSNIPTIIANSLSYGGMANVVIEITD
ncbi:hypothetical protein [Algoriphagus jejuensis]